MTIPAKRLRHRADDTDLAAPIEVAVTRGDFAAIGRADRCERPFCSDAFDDFFRRHHALDRPVVSVPHVHKFDEPHRVSPRPKILAQRQQLAVVHAALHHGIDLDRKSQRRRRVDAAQHPLHAEAETIQFSRRRIVERIHRHVEPVEPRRAQGRCEFFEQPTVRRERDILHAELLLQDSHELRHIGAEQGLAARQAHFVHPQRLKRPHNPRELIEGHELRVAEKRVTGSEHFLRHAVRAAKVAAIRYRNAQVAQRAVELVGGGAHGDCSLRGSRLSLATTDAGDEPCQCVPRLQAASFKK